MAQFQVKKPQAKTLQERMGFVDSDLTTASHDSIMLWLDEQMTNTQLASWLGLSGWEKADLLQKKMDDAFHSYMTRFAARLKDATNREETTRQQILLYQEKGDDKWDGVHIRRLQDDLPDFQRATIQAQEQLDAAKATAVKPSMPDWPGLQVTRKEWEMPIMDRTYTIGFVDLVVHFEAPSLSLPQTSDYRADQCPSWIRSRNHLQMYCEVKTTIPSLGELLRQLSLYREHLNRGMVAIPVIFVVSPDTRFEAKIREQGYGFIQAPEVR